LAAVVKLTSAAVEVVMIALSDKPPDPHLLRAPRVDHPRGVAVEA
jgi:hypothetical protein